VAAAAADADALQETLFAGLGAIPPLEHLMLTALFLHHRDFGHSPYCTGCAVGRQPAHHNQRCAARTGSAEPKCWPLYAFAYIKMSVVSFMCAHAEPFSRAAFLR
jgi:hypothetical protein